MRARSAVATELKAEPVPCSPRRDRRLVLFENVFRDETFTQNISDSCERYAALPVCHKLKDPMHGFLHILLLSAVVLGMQVGEKRNITAVKLPAKSKEAWQRQGRARCLYPAGRLQLKAL